MDGPLFLSLSLYKLLTCDNDTRASTKKDQYSTVLYSQYVSSTILVPKQQVGDGEEDDEASTTTTTTTTTPNNADETTGFFFFFFFL